MKEGLLIGGGIVAAGIFVGFVAYKLVKRKPKILKHARKTAFDIGKKTSRVAAEAKRAFVEGFDKAQAKVATA